MSEKNIEMLIKSKLYDYSVLFTDNCREVLSKFDYDKIVLVVDSNIYRLYSDLFANIKKEKIYFMIAEESKKNMDTVMDIINFFRKNHVQKNWKVICFGGGITQDVTTIASNLYLRNIEWIFFPTTLLSMCDSCIGGKCGINLGIYKNQIGVFYPPRKIYIDTRFIDTLSEADYINGWGEILKFSLTSNVDFFNDLIKQEKYIPCDNIKEYIERSLDVKKNIIEKDEFESDIRRILNYGHTFGHALEAYTENKFSHGIGVIWGIDVVNYIAYREKLISSDYYFEIKKLIKTAFLNEEIRIDDPFNVLDIIKTDKKVKNNTISLALLDNFSHLKIYPMEMDEKFKRLFLDYLEETHEYYSS